MSTLAGRLAVVTGGTSGIGRATALVLAAAQCRVTATGLLDAEIEACHADPAFANIELAKLDVGDARSVEDWFAQQPALDILVNAAGIARGSDEFTERGFLRTLDINLNGTMRCCYAARELLAASRGAIVNIASMMSFFGSATGPAYAASKGGIVQLTKSLAVAWAPHGIRCNAVAPGWIDTPMTRANLTPVQIEKLSSATKFNRLPTLDDVTSLVMFLCSPQNSGITGQFIAADLGFSRVHLL